MIIKDKIVIAENILNKDLLILLSSGSLFEHVKQARIARMVVELGFYKRAAPPDRVVYH